MTGKTYRKGDVLIDGQRIKSVGENIPAGMWSGHDVSIIDAGGLHVYPGFIDAHSHIGIDVYKRQAWNPGRKLGMEDEGAGWP